MWSGAEVTTVESQASGGEGSRQQSFWFKEHIGVDVGKCCLQTTATRLLKLDALLGADAGVEGMFDFTHLSDEIGGFD